MKIVSLKIFPAPGANIVDVLTSVVEATKQSQAMGDVSIPPDTGAVKQKLV